MRMIEESARRVPWNRPEHFYEGLNTLWFCCDVMGVVDALGNSSLSRPDYLLYGLYRNDIDSGFMTEEEAYDLVRRFIVLGDSHYDKDVTVVKGADHELEMGVVLGGCDEQGSEVYNDIYMFTIIELMVHGIDDRHREAGVRATPDGLCRGDLLALGWLVKYAITKYGGATAYQEFKPMMIGLIAGEMLAGVIPLIIGGVYYLVTGQIPKPFAVLRQTENANRECTCDD